MFIFEGMWVDMLLFSQIHRCVNVIISNHTATALRDMSRRTKKGHAEHCLNRSPLMPPPTLFSPKSEHESHSEHSTNHMAASFRVLYLLGFAVINVGDEGKDT